MSAHGDIFAAARSIFDGATRFIVELYSFAFISICLRSKHSYLQFFDIGRAQPYASRRVDGVGSLRDSCPGRLPRRDAKAGHLPSHTKFKINSSVLGAGSS